LRRTLPLKLGSRIDDTVTEEAGGSIGKTTTDFAHESQENPLLKNKIDQKGESAVKKRDK